MWRDMGIGMGMGRGGACVTVPWKENTRTSRHEKRYGDGKGMGMGMGWAGGCADMWQDMGMDDSQQSPSASDLCLINFHLSIVYSIRFLDRIDDPLFDRTDEDLTFFGPFAQKMQWKRKSPLCYGEKILYKMLPCTLPCEITQTLLVERQLDRSSQLTLEIQPKII